MSTAYPGAIDSYTVKVDNVDDVMAAHVNNLQDAVVAVESAIGVGGFVAINEGRLSLSSGVPITTSDVTGATTIYFTPYIGERVTCYDVNFDRYDTFVFTEISVAVPATTNTPFDVFLISNGGALLEITTVDWTNDTTRAVGLTKTDGVWHLTGTQTARYLGTGRTTSVSGQCEDSVTKRFLWNYYNRFARRMAISNTTSHTYNVATTRAFNNDAANSRVEFVIGILEESVLASVHAEVSRLAYDNGVPTVALGVNSTSSQSIGSQVAMSGYVGALSAGARISALPAIGYNYVCGVEHAVVDISAPTFASVDIDAILRG